MIDEIIIKNDTYNRNNKKNNNDQKRELKSKEENVSLEHASVSSDAVSVSLLLIFIYIQ